MTRGALTPLLTKLTGVRRQGLVRFAGYLSSATAPITSLYLNRSTLLDTDTAREEAINFRALTVFGGAAQHSWLGTGQELDITHVEVRRGEAHLSRVEGLAVSGGFRHRAGTSVATLTTFPLPAHRTQRTDFPRWALIRDHAFAHAKLRFRTFRRATP